MHSILTAPAFRPLPVLGLLDSPDPFPRFFSTHQLFRARAHKGKGLGTRLPPADGFAALSRASGGRVVEFTNYMLASMQKAFSNRETPIGKAPAHY